MIRITQLIPEFRSADQAAYIESYPFEQLLYRTVFPEKYVSDLTWKSIEASKGAKVMADVVAFNSRAPRKGRPLPGKKWGDIPKVEIARDKTETDFNLLRGLQRDFSTMPAGRSRDQVQRQIIDWMYNDGTFVVDGVNARLEWLSKRVASTGKYSLTLTDNEAGVITTTDVDFEIPGGNKVNAALAWSNPSSDPIYDFEARKQAAKAIGRVLRYAHMEDATWNRLKRNPNFQKFCATYVANALNLQQTPTLEAANAALKSQGLMEIVLWDSFVTIEGKDGTQTATSGWEPNIVTFSETRELGDTQHTMTADEYVNVGKATKTKSGIVLVKVWAEEDPITVITKGTAYATPVLNNAKHIHLLNTEPVPTT